MARRGAVLRYFQFMLDEISPQFRVITVVLFIILHAV